VPMPVPEETKDYGYNRPGDAPGPFLSDDKHNWSKAPSRRSFKSDGGESDAQSTKYQVSKSVSTCHWVRFVCVSGYPQD
jgi:hypothetical protein